jgi:hypothetical protein
VVLAVIALAAPFFTRKVLTGSLVRHIGKYDSMATIPPSRRVLHLYFTEGPRGMRGGHWTYEISAVIGSGVPASGSDAGEVQFAGYDRDGRVLFVRRTSFARDARPGLTYMADVPATPALERGLGRIDVSYRGQTYTRRALPDAPPSARAVAVDASHVLIQLDCAHYSSVLVHYTMDRDLTAASDDVLETVRNCWTRSGSTSLHTPIETRNRTIYLDFNNGLLYTERNVPVRVSEGRPNGRDGSVLNEPRTVPG